MRRRRGQRLRRRAGRTGGAVPLHDRRRTGRTASARISVLDLEGNVQMRWGDDPAQGLEFVAPHGITVDRRGNVYVGEVRQAGRRRPQHLASSSPQTRPDRLSHSGWFSGRSASSVTETSGCWNANTTARATSSGGSGVMASINGRILGALRVSGVSTAPARSASRECRTRRPPCAPSARSQRRPICWRYTPARRRTRPRPDVEAVSRMWPERCRCMCGSA